MLVSFAIVQFVPGGPVERAIAQLQGLDEGATSRIGGGGGQIGAGAMAHSGGDISSRYRGAQGLDPKFIKELEKQYGFDKPAPERFCDPGQGLCDVQSRPQLFSRRAGAQPDQGKAAGVDFARPVDDASSPMRSRSRSASGRRFPTARVSTSGPRASSSSAMRSRASCSRSCWSCCSAAARSGRSFRFAA